MIHQVGIALAKSGYGCIFGIASATFEPLQNQHPVAFVLADATTDRLQPLTQGAGGLPLAFTGVNLDAFQAARALVGAHFRVQVGQLHQLAGRTATCADHLHAVGFGGQGAGHIFDIKQAQIQHRVELVEHHHRIEVAGYGPFGDVPAPLGLLPVEAGRFLGAEKVSPARAHLVDQVGEALLQGFDGGVFVVGPAGPLEKAQQQHPCAFLLADTQADGAQNHP